MISQQIYNSPSLTLPPSSSGRRQGSRGGRRVGAERLVRRSEGEEDRQPLCSKGKGEWEERKRYVTVPFGTHRPALCHPPFLFLSPLRLATYTHTHTHTHTSAFSLFPPHLQAEAADPNAGPSYRPAAAPPTSSGKGVLSGDAALRVPSKEVYEM